MNGRHASTVVGFVREQETPDQVINGTSPVGLAQVEGWVLTEVAMLYGATERSVSFNRVAATKRVDRPLLGPLLALLVDSGQLVWADDGGYLPVGGAT